MNKERTNTLKVIVIGAGAISQQWHLPILLGRKDFEVVGVIDKSPKICSEIKTAYPDIAVHNDVSELSSNEFECAIVATPAAFHYQISKELLLSGKHVLVEKPIAFTATQAQELVDIAKSQNLILSVSLYRRLYPSLSLLKSIIISEKWGKPKHFLFNWGDFYSWSASSLGNMKKELAGGGVLMDLGPHALDWLCFLFGENISLNQYSDDAKSGIETDCHLQLAFMYKRRKLKGDVLLSRIRALGGDLIVECEHASLKLSVGERFKVDVQPKKHDDQRASNDLFESLSYQASQPNICNEDWFETFAKEHEDFANAIMSKVEPELSAGSVIPAAKIIDECYASKKQLDFDWATVSHMAWPSLSGLKRIFISGASGFVGGRIVEVFTETTDVAIVAGVNNPNNATRLSRYELEIAKCDLNDFESLNRALKGCDAVIHCAVGTAYGDDGLIYKTTVEGTKNLLNASLNNGVKKFIHMSSLAAIDMENAKGILDETSCTESTSQDIYAKSKLAAEKAVLEHAETTNLDVAVLRPTTIYGPYSPLFKIGAGKQAVTNGIQLSESNARSPSNSIYIDNVVLAIMHILKALPRDASNIKSPSDALYFLNDDDGFSYRDFYAYFTKSFDCPLKVTHNSTQQKSFSNKEKSHVSAIFSETKSIIASKEMRKLLLKTYNSKTIGLPARWLLNKFPKLEDKFRDSRGPVFLQKSKTKRTPTQIESSTAASVSMSKFKQDFPNYEALKRDKCLDLTQKWISFSQIAKKG